MRHTVKMYCLPAHLDEEKLRELQQAIVKVFVDHRDLQVATEQDLLVLFIPDLMKHGLGSAVLVEIDLFDEPSLKMAIRKSVARNVGVVILQFCSGAKVQCRPYRFVSDDIWTSYPMPAAKPKGVNFADTLHRR